MKVIFFLASLVVYASNFDFGFLEGEASPVKLKLVDSAGQRLEKLCDHLRRFNAAHLISSERFFDNVFKINRICGKMMSKLNRNCADLTWPKALENDQKTLRTRREEKHSTDPYENPLAQLQKSGRNVFDWISAHLGECPNAEGQRRRVQLRIVERFSRQFSKLAGDEQ